MWLLALACAPPPRPAARSRCDAAAGGPALEATLPEADGGLEDEIAAAPVEELPDLLDTSALDPLSLALLAYALELPQDEVSPELPPSAADRVGPELGAAVLASFAQAEPGVLDVDFLRRGLQRYYACDRGFPETLDGFRATFGDWEAGDRVEVPDSVVKLGPRTLHELPERGLFVAESADGDGLDTEILLSGLREDGALDFVAYDPAGRLAAVAPLAFGGEIGGYPAPYACALCHRDLMENTFTVVHP